MCEEESSRQKRRRTANEPTGDPSQRNRQPTLSQFLGTPDVPPDIVTRPKTKPKPKAGKKKQRLKDIDPRKEGYNLHKFLKRRKLE